MSKKKTNKTQKADFQSMVVDFFNEHPTGSYNYKQISLELGITRRINQYQIADILDDMVLDGFLSELVPGRYQATQITSASEGTFVRRSNGKNGVIIDNTDVPIFVAERKLSTPHLPNSDL